MITQMTTPHEGLVRENDIISLMNITRLRTLTGGKHDQLAIYKPGRGTELSSTENNFGQWSEPDFEPRPFGF